MCVICVQGIAKAQKKLQDPFTPVELRVVLGRDVQGYESNIQTRQRAIERIEPHIRVQRSALQGESCPKGNRS